MLVLQRSLCLMKRHSLAAGGGLFSLGVVWSHFMCVKANHAQGRSAFSAPTPTRSPASAVSGTARGTAGAAVQSPKRRRPRSQLIFIGTGSSMAVPGAFHLLHPERNSRHTAIAQLAVATPPETNKNYRGNTSVLVRVVKDGGGSKGRKSEMDIPAVQEMDEVEGGDEEGGRQVQHVQIDTGKTWREGVIRWYPRHGITGLDGIVLTHDHADAILGLDDVRSLQDARNRTPIPVHVSRKTDRSVRRMFPYLIGREDDNGADGRVVAALKFNVFQDFKPFEVGGLKVTPFPVLHGEDYISHGFLFGPEGSRICYISDVSRVPPESIDFLREQSPVQLLVCDALMTTEKHQTHFSVEDGVALAGELKAQRTFLVGLGGSIEYHETNAMLESKEREEGAPYVRLAYDGLAVDIDLD